MTEIDYTTIAIISTLSGFAGAIGTELAKAAIRSALHLKDKITNGDNQNE